MFPDPVTGVAYATEAELLAVKADRQKLYESLIKSSERSAQAQATRRAELDGLWAGMEERSSVLISERFSRLISPMTSTPRGIVQLDGLLEQRIGHLGRVRVHFLFDGHAMPTFQETVQIQDSELESLGHPFTWWHPKRFVKTAIDRSMRYGRKDQWKPTKDRYWEG